MIIMDIQDEQHQLKTTEQPPTNGEGSHSSITSPTLPNIDKNITPALSILYKPDATFTALHSYLHQVIEVRVPSLFISTTNPAVQKRHLWGTDYYTADSDAVAILLHTGADLVRSTPPTGIGISLIFRVLPERESYPSSTRYDYRSRSWLSSYDNPSLTLELVVQLTGLSILEARPLTITYNKHPIKLESFPLLETQSDKLIRMCEAEDESSASRIGVKQKRRLAPNITVRFDQDQNPCLIYSLSILCDKGHIEADWVSSELRYKAYYFNSGHKRYELSQESYKESDGGSYKYRWAEIDVSDSFRRAAARSTVPVVGPLVKVLESGIDFEEIGWGNESVRIRGKLFLLDTYESLPRTHGIFE